MLEKVNYILDQKKYQSKISSVAEAAHTCWVADQIGKKYGFISKKFKSGTLEIAVPNSLIALELRMKNQLLLREINIELKKDKVKKLRFVLAAST